MIVVASCCILAAKAGIIERLNEQETTSIMAHDLEFQSDFYNGDGTLTEKARWNIIKVFLQTVDKRDCSQHAMPDAKYLDENGEGKPVFGIGTDTIRRLHLVSDNKGKWKEIYSKGLPLWLRQFAGYKNAPLDLFTRPLSCSEKLLYLMQNGDRAENAYHKKVTLIKSKPAGEHRASTRLAHIAKSSHDPAYFSTNTYEGKTSAQIDGEILRKIIVEDGASIPIQQLGELPAERRLCTGCGGGADYYDIVGPCLEAMWTRLNDDKSSIGDHEGMLSFGKFSIHVAKGLLTNGELVRAREISNSVEMLFTLGQLTDESQAGFEVRSDARRIAIESQADAEPWIVQRRKDIENYYSPKSRKFYSSMKCRACRAIATGSPMAQECIADLKDAYEIFKCSHEHDAQLVDEEGKDQILLETIHVMNQANASDASISESLNTRI